MQFLCLGEISVSCVLWLLLLWTSNNVRSTCSNLVDELKKNQSNSQKCYTHFFILYVALKLSEGHAFACCRFKTKCTLLEVGINREFLRKEFLERDWKACFIKTNFTQIIAESKILITEAWNVPTASFKYETIAIAFKKARKNSPWKTGWCSLLTINARRCSNYVSLFRLRFFLFWVEYVG